jgi:hypothetical protein
VVYFFFSVLARAPMAMAAYATSFVFRVSCFVFRASRAFQLPAPSVFIYIQHPAL